MASPRLASAHYSATRGQRYRRSSFNGAKQLQAAGAQNRRVLVAIGLLAVALVAALVVVAFHLAAPHA